MTATTFVRRLNAQDTDFNSQLDQLLSWEGKCV